MAQSKCHKKPTVLQELSEIKRKVSQLLKMPVLRALQKIERRQEFLIRLIRSDKRLVVKIKGENITAKGESVMVDFTKVGQFVDIELEILDAKGRPAAIDGDITVSNSDPSVGEVTLDQTTRTGRLTCLGEGIGHIDFECDAKIGPDVKPLVGTLDYTGPNLTEAQVFNVKVGPIQEPAA